MEAFGILEYDFPRKRATNIGDYVQSLAALAFIESTGADVKLVNRERLAQWSGGPVNLIMNGWYMHDPGSWPPSVDINPLYVALHINSSVYERFAEADSLAHLRRHEPIGCRDTKTQEFLAAHGIEAYFSGCLTITLDRERYGSDEARQGVLFCDIAHGRGSFRSLARRTDVSITQKVLRVPRVIKERYSLINADVLTDKLSVALNDEPFEHLTTQMGTRLTETERFNAAKESLRRYARARLVVTSRIHVALPCIAFGTPVLFINPDYDNGRFPGLSQFFTTLAPSDVMEADASTLREMLMNVKNPDTSLPYRKRLTETVEDFINKRR